MSLYAKIRRMHFRARMPISQIARKTSLSRNTIKTWLKAPLHAELKYERRMNGDRFTYARFNFREK